jgi:hypothetical protein
VTVLFWRTEKPKARLRQETGIMKTLTAFFYHVRLASILPRIFIAFLFAVLLNACQTAAPDNSGVVFDDSALRQHNLDLSNAKASFNDGALTLSSGVWPTQKRPHIACGQLQLQIFDTQGVLLKTVNADYSPCHLHYQPNTRRAGYFSVMVSDLHPQPLIIRTSYKKKPNEAH